MVDLSAKKSIIKELQVKHFEIISDEKAKMQTYQDLSDAYKVPVHEVSKLHVSVTKEAREKVESMLPKKPEDLNDEDVVLIPRPYSVNKKGVRRIKKNSEGEEKLEIISKSSFFLRRYFVNKLDNSVLVEMVILEASGEIKVIMPIEKLSNNRAVSDLSRYGLHCTSDNAKAVVRYLADQFQMLKSKRDPSYAVFKSGWFSIKGKHGFSFGSNCIIPGFEAIRLNEKEGSAFQDDTFKCKGDEEAFYNKLNRLLALSPVLVFEIGVALSSPLLWVLGIDNAIFHKYGNSSIGKTIGMTIALSMIGKPGISGLIRRWRTTTNGIEAIAGEYNDIILALDDLSQKVGRTSDDVYLLGNGQGKQRANKDGTARDVEFFRLLVKSNGEQPILDDNDLQGTMARVIETKRSTFDGVGISALEIRELKSFFENNYGFPYRAFIDEVVSIVNDSSRLSELRAEFDSLSNLYVTHDNNYINRLVPVFACIHLVLRILSSTSAKIELEEGVIHNSVSLLLEDQKSRLSYSNDLPRRALDYVWEHILSESTKPEFITGQNFIPTSHRVHGSGYAILKKNLKKILVDGGFPYQSCCRYFKEQEWVWLDDKGDLLTIKMGGTSSACRPYTFDESVAFELGILSKTGDDIELLQNYMGIEHKEQTLAEFLKEN